MVVKGKKLSYKRAETLLQSLVPWTVKVGEETVDFSKLGFFSVGKDLIVNHTMGKKVWRKFPSTKKSFSGKGYGSGWPFNSSFIVLPNLSLSIINFRVLQKSLRCDQADQPTATM